MDNELTEKMQVWLNAGPHTETEDIMDGALMLLRVNRNRVFYQNVMLQPQKLAATVEYEMRKVLKIRLDGLTMDEVGRMDHTVTPEVRKAYVSEPKDGEGNIIEDGTLPEVKEDMVTRNGKRADHDQLPDEIRDIWTANAERWKKIKELYNTLLGLRKACDRYEYLKQMKELWYSYKDQFNRYDDYVIGSDDGDNGSDTSSGEGSMKDVNNARAYISKNLKTLQAMKPSVSDGTADEKSVESFNSLLAKVQERVNTVISAGEPIGDELRKSLEEVGVMFPMGNSNQQENAEG